ncbi:MAG: GNAT family N-acetyltransferase [Clostridia bacterium]|nr:GNAT family N-acetyltransferase [Clostridia bacterium]
MIRYAELSDKAFWFSLDKHMSEAEFEKKVRDQQGYVALSDGEPVGILRFSLFWDNTPFCNLLYVKDGMRGRGIGKALMERFEEDARKSGYKFVLTSTRSDEDAQHFYRAIGYHDCGELRLPDEPSELFFRKEL